MNKLTCSEIAQHAREIVLSELNLDGITCKAVGRLELHTPLRFVLNATDEDFNLDTLQFIDKLNLRSELRLLAKNLMDDPGRKGSTELGTMALNIPASLEGNTDYFDGLSIRVLKAYDIDGDCYKLAFDIFYNWL